VYAASNQKSVEGRGFVIDISWLVEHGPCKKFVAGQRIPCPGGPDAADRAMYILLTGRVDVFRASAAGGTQEVGSLLPGDVFGGREYFTDVDDHVYTAGVSSVVYVINEGSFNDLSWSRPDILFEVLKAAYMPLRKLTASQKNVLAAAAEPTANQKAEEPPVAAAAPKAKGKHAPKAEPEPKPGPEGASVGMPAPEPVTGSIFPEGHKSYPGITRPIYSKLVFSKDYDCPFCKKPFTDYKIFRSKLYESAPVRYDLRRFYTDFPYILRRAQAAEERVDRGSACRLKGVSPSGF
jgi:hypothetical protein